MYQRLHISNLSKDAIAPLKKIRFAPMDIPCLSSHLGDYDMIIGRDMLADLQIDLHFSDNTVHCLGTELLFKSTNDGNLLDTFLLLA